ncbi:MULTISPECIES: hypothetical protein [Sinorhizobium]|nr:MULTISPECIES: hypothetical protein [Sinorhizobium]MBP1882402.1 hypothetical protein [Sinorhizobium mexicanum]MDK1373366.1 hypothetical protein [Sinorhizobium sp. 6-70]MDK1481163.1 hypothetical protein [Sinorhizobium sp. 6-117]
MTARGSVKRYQINAEQNLKRQQTAAEMMGGEPLAAAQIEGIPG